MAVEHLYFIKCEDSRGLVKIGRAVDVARRLKNMQVGCPYPLRLIRSFAIGPDSPISCARLERVVHERLAHARFRGEWVEYDYAVAMIRTLTRYIADIEAGRPASLGGAE